MISIVDYSFEQCTSLSVYMSCYVSCYSSLFFFVSLFLCDSIISSVEYSLCSSINHIFILLEHCILLSFDLFLRPLTELVLAITQSCITCQITSISLYILSKIRLDIDSVTCYLIVQIRIASMTYKIYKLLSWPAYCLDIYFILSSFLLLHSIFVHLPVRFDLLYYLVLSNFYFYVW